MIAGTLVVVLAVVLAVVPVSPEAVERWYSQGVYPALQQVLTSASNLVSVALLDVAAAVLLAAALVRLVRARSWWARIRGAVLGVIVTAASIYVVFVLVWGLNYRRLPLEAKLQFDAARVSPAALVRLANDAAARVNSGYAGAHALTFDPSALDDALVDAQFALGDPTPIVPGRPKHSLLSLYFRRAAIDGMTDPLFLEIIVNPDLLIVERPMVVAHEWAHLAGYAHESEANFVAWLACLRGDALARYSAWLAAYQHAIAQMPPGDHASVAPLDAGPRSDLRAIAARYERAMPLLRRASREVYDSYLKANRVAEGIASYDAVIRLMLGTTFASEGVPRLRSR